MQKSSEGFCLQQDLLRRIKKGATPLLCAKQVVVGKGAVVLDQRIVAVALQVAVRFAICIHITDKSKYRELLLKAGEVIAVNRIADAGKGQQVPVSYTHLPSSAAITPAR